MVSSILTCGVLHSEYGAVGKASRKSDVFSYGIMLLDVFTGKRPTDPKFVGELSVRRWVLDAFPAGFAEVIDPDLLPEERAGGFDDTSTRSNPGSTPTALDGCVVSILKLGLLCSSESPFFFFAKAPASHMTEGFR